MDVEVAFSCFIDKKLSLIVSIGFVLFFFMNCLLFELLTYFYILIGFLFFLFFFFFFFFFFSIFLFLLVSLKKVVDIFYLFFKYLFYASHGIHIFLLLSLLESSFSLLRT